VPYDEIGTVLYRLLHFTAIQKLVSVDNLIIIIITIIIIRKIYGAADTKKTPVMLKTKKKFN